MDYSTKTGNALEIDENSCGKIITQSIALLNFFPEDYTLGKAIIKIFFILNLLYYFLRMINLL